MGSRHLNTPQTRQKMKFLFLLSIFSLTNASLDWIKQQLEEYQILNIEPNGNWNFDLFEIHASKNGNHYDFTSMNNFEEVKMHFMFTESDFSLEIKQKMRGDDQFFTAVFDGEYDSLYGYVSSFDGHLKLDYLYNTKFGSYELDIKTDEIEVTSESVKGGFKILGPDYSLHLGYEVNTKCALFTKGCTALMFLKLDNFFENDAFFQGKLVFTNKGKIIVGVVENNLNYQIKFTAFTDGKENIFDGKKLTVRYNINWASIKDRGILLKTPTPKGYRKDVYPVFFEHFKQIKSVYKISRQSYQNLILSIVYADYIISALPKEIYNFEDVIKSLDFRSKPISKFIQKYLIPYFKPTVEKYTSINVDNFKPEDTILVYELAVNENFVNWCDKWSDKIGQKMPKGREYANNLTGEKGREEFNTIFGECISNF